MVCTPVLHRWHDQLEEYPKTNLEEMKRKNRWKKRPFETPVSSQPVSINASFAIDLKRMNQYTVIL